MLLKFKIEHKMDIQNDLYNITYYNYINSIAFSMNFLVLARPWFLITAFTEKKFIKTIFWNSAIRSGIFCSANGFPKNFQIYYGKDEARESPLRSHVVMTMLEPIEN